MQEIPKTRALSLLVLGPVALEGFFSSHLVVAFGATPIPVVWYDY